MALVDVGGLWMPDIAYYSGTTAPGYTSNLLDASADRVAVVFYAPKTGNIRKLSFLTGTVPAIDAASTLVYALQNVSLTTGDPDGSDDETATIAAGTIAASTMLQSGNLSADRAVTKGDLVAAVVRYGVFTAGDQVNIQTMAGLAGKIGPGSNGSYVTINLSGSYVKQNAAQPVIEIEYDDGTYAYSETLSQCWNALTNDVYNNTSTPDEIGLRFQVPFACRLAGLWASVDLDGDCNVNLYTAAGKTTMKSIDKEVRLGTGPGTIVWPEVVTPVVLAANTTYVLALEPSSATSLTLYSGTVRAAGVMGQMVGGTEWQYATAKNPATTADFSATTTKRPFMGLKLDQIDNGVPGFLRHPGMAGGLNA